MSNHCIHGNELNSARLVKFTTIPRFQPLNETRALIWHHMLAHDHQYDRSTTAAGIKHGIGTTEAFGTLSVRFPRPLVQPPRYDGHD